MKKIVSIIAVASLLAVMLCACSSTSKQTATEAETKATEAETVTEEAAPAETEAETEEAAEPVETEAETEEAAEPAEEAKEAAFTNEITINLMGSDVPVEMAINGDGTFTAKYAFNGNDVVANGTMAEDGSLTLTDHTPETVPAQYVQGALDLVAEAFAAEN